MRRHSKNLGLLAFLLVLGGLSEAWGQGQLSTATLTGRITDTSGAAIPGVQLSLQNKVGGAPQTTISNGAGYYSLKFLQPGTYELVATKAGFSRVVVPGLSLSVHQTANVNLTMQPGKVVQQIQVSATETALQTQTSSLSGHVPTLQVTQLPLAEPDSTLLVNLVPGVTLDNRNQNTTTYRGIATEANVGAQAKMAFSINGGNVSAGIEVVDGVDVSFGREEFPESPMQITPEFDADMQVLTNNLPAEFGGGAGVVNLVTKSGTDSFHGTAYEYWQNSALNANNLFANSQHQSKPYSNLNQFGFSVGGPIIKNKAWFFGDYEDLRHVQGDIVETSVPTAAERAGDFSGLITTVGQPITIFNPYNTSVNPATGQTLRQPFAGNVIPSSMFDQFGANLMKYYPPPNNPGLIASNGQATGIDNLFFSGTLPLTNYLFDVKGNYDLGHKNRMMVRFSQNGFHVTPAQIYHTVANPAGLSQDNCTDFSRNVAVSLTSTLSPTLVLTQSISITRDNNYTINPSAGFNPTSLGGPYTSGTLLAFAKNWDGGGMVFPNVTVTNYGPMGEGRPVGGYNDHTSAYTYQAMVAKVWGAHTFEAGFEGVLNQNGDLTEPGYSGSFDYTGMFTQGPNPLTPSVNTGNALADMLLGTLGGGDMSTGYTDFKSSKYVAGFIEDDWRATPKLTLNLGFRYDFTTPYVDRFNHLPRFDPLLPNPIGSDTGPNTNGQTLNQYLTSLGGGPVLGTVVFANSPAANGRGITPIDFTTGIEPRLGFAYAITPKLVFRGGFSRLDFRSPGGSQITLAPPPGDAATNTIVGTVNGINPAVTTSNPFPSGLLTPTYESLGELTGLGTPLSMGTFTDRTPFAWEWNAGFQYSLSKVGVLSVAYAAARERQLACPLGQCGDQVPEADLSKFGSKLLSSVPNPFYGIITTPGSLLSAPTVEFGNLLRMNTAYQSWSNSYGPSYQGPNGDTFTGAWNALEVGLNAPAWHNVSTMVAYTVSKNITNADGQTGGYLQPTAGYQNVYNFQGETSLSAMDVPQRLVIGYVYQLPFGRGKRFASSASPLLNKVIGGWEWGGIITDQSGFPVPISETGQTTGAFAGGDRPNLVGNPCLSSSRSRGDKIIQYLNPAAFQTQPNFSFGDAPRLLDCRADGEKDYDMNLNKTTQLTERFGLQFRVDAFNLFNRPQLSKPNTVFNSTSFGTITSQYNLPRSIQFGLKFIF